MQRFILLTALFLGLFSFFTAKAEQPKFALTTQAFSNTGILPVLYTCDGKDISPDFSWINMPTKTQSFALILSDPDAPTGTFYHWVLFNIPKNINKLDQAMSRPPVGTLVGKNSWEKAQYNGPCPPKGKAHTYIFTLYALDTKLSLPKGTDADTIIKAINNHIVQQTQLSTVYSRWLGNR